jgi:hypothetical protein
MLTLSSGLKCVGRGYDGLSRQVACSSTSRTIRCHFTGGHDLVNHCHAELSVLKLYILRYILAPSSNHCCHGNPFVGAFAKFRKAT